MWIGQRVNSTRAWQRDEEQKKRRDEEKIFVRNTLRTFEVSKIRNIRYK